MTPDGELLHRYAAARCEESFAELVRRHLDLVYSAALRQVNGDAHLAQDVAQTVFADLARKAAALADRPVLTGWLYTSTHFAAAKAVRTERRRLTREEEAHAMQELLQHSATDPDWDRLRPVLDAAMLELDEPDREAVLLRYFENRRHAEIAARLGLSENAARMRVERALEKLRALLSRRGVTTTAAFSAVITAHAVQAAPAGLAAAIATTAALAGATLTTTATVTTTKAIAMTTLQKSLAATVLAAAVGTSLYEARQVSRLEGEMQNLHERQQPLVEQLRRERDAMAGRLAAKQEEVAQLQRDLADLPRLRGEVTRMRAGEQETAGLRTTAPRPASPPAANDPKPAGNELPKDSWADAGFATPQDALRTRGWSVLNGNRDRFKDSIFITDGARKTLEDLFVRMVEASKDPNKAKYLQEILNNKFGVEEGILMPMMAENKRKNYTGYRILSQQSPSADEAMLEVETQMASAPPKKETLKFRRFGSDWKVVIDEEFIKSAH